MQAAVIGGSIDLLSGLVAAGIVPHVVRGRGVPDRLPDGVVAVEAPLDLFAALGPPRVYLMEAPPGPGVDAILEAAYPTMEPGDAVVDLTGSWWCDTLRRCRRMRHRSLWYVDAARLVRGGRPVLVAAGDPGGIGIALPVLAAWAAPGAALHVGGPGLAHFALAVEEAARASIHHAQSEAAQMLQAWPGPADHDRIDALWPLPPPVDAGGRAAWVPEDALRLEASLPHLAQATMLVLAEALDARRPAPVPPKLGPFGLPDEILEG
ncbi:MAG: hypothetical protein KDG89_13140 [Geminicoccaceae bacterium]|nr:hypothetical protein [Geminicoccaceae bacterium]